MASAMDQKKLDGCLLNRLGVGICEAQDLLALTDFDIVLVVDDSGSMRLQNAPRHGVTRRTRWDELKETVQVVIEIATCLDSDGLDVHFLNLGSLRGVTTVNDQSLQAYLTRGPVGSTPLTETVLRVAGDLSGSKPVIMVVLTDGEPNGGCERFKQAVQWAIKERNVRFQIMACTDSEREIAWLNQFDQDFDQVDVTDDFESEKQEILGKGHFKTFSRADWVLKALLGAIDSRLDSLDEAPRKSSKICEQEAEDSNEVSLQTSGEAPPCPSKLCKQDARDPNEVMISVVKHSNSSSFDKTNEMSKRPRMDKKSRCSPGCTIC